MRVMFNMDVCVCLWLFGHCYSCGYVVMYVDVNECNVCYVCIFLIWDFGDLGITMAVVSYCRVEVVKIDLQEVKA